MDVGRRVLWRLERIESLSRGCAAKPKLLGELRALVREAEALPRDGAERAHQATPELQEEVGGMS